MKFQDLRLWLWNWNLEVASAAKKTKSSSVPRQILVAFRIFFKATSNNGVKSSATIPILVLQKYPTHLYFLQFLRPKWPEWIRRMWPCSFGSKRVSTKWPFAAEFNIVGHKGSCFGGRMVLLPLQSLTAAVDAKRWPKPNRIKPDHLNQLPSHHVAPGANLFVC